jgi:acyl-CoA thioesterase FadM
MDVLGHLNHSVYHELFYEARCVLMEPIRTARYRHVLASDAVDYLAEVRHDHGYVDVTVHVEAIGRKSVTLMHEMRLPDGALAARNRVVLVAWDAVERRSRDLSGQERALLRPPGPRRDPAAPRA